MRLLYWKSSREAGRGWREQFDRTFGASLVLFSKTNICPESLNLSGFVVLRRGNQWWSCSLAELSIVV